MNSPITGPNQFLEDCRRSGISVEIEFRNGSNLRGKLLEVDHAALLVREAPANNTVIVARSTMKSVGPVSRV